MIYKPNKKNKMKKITMLAIAAVAISFASCKKDYTCKCTFTSGGVTETSSVTIHTTKSKATDACNTTATSGGSGYVCAIQ